MSEKHENESLSGTGESTTDRPESVEDPTSNEKKSFLSWRESCGCGLLISLASLCLAVFALAVAGYTAIFESGILPPLRPTSTPSLPRCTITKDTYLYPTTDTRFGDTYGYPFLPAGTEVELVGTAPGIFTMTYQIASYSFDGGPIVVVEIQPASPAAEAGLQVGDVLLKGDHISFEDRSTMIKHIRENLGLSIELLVRRNGEEIKLNVVPRISPSEGQGHIGFFYEGGRLQGDGGYVATWVVSCVESTESP